MLAPLSTTVFALLAPVIVALRFLIFSQKCVQYAKSTVSITIEFTRHALTFTLFTYTPVHCVHYERGGMLITIKRPGTTTFHLIMTEARSLGLRYAILSIMGVSFIGNINQIMGATQPQMVHLHEEYNQEPPSFVGLLKYDEGVEGGDCWPKPSRFQMVCMYFAAWILNVDITATTQETMPSNQPTEQLYPRRYSVLRRNWNNCWTTCHVHPQYNALFLQKNYKTTEGGQRKPSTQK